MSVQIALNFLRHAREDETIQSALRALVASPHLAAPGASNREGEVPPPSLVALGAQHGFLFNAHDLQLAFRYDWRLRWHHFQARSEQQDPAPEQSNRTL